LIPAELDYIDAINDRSKDNKLAEWGYGSLIKIDCFGYRW